MPTGIRPLQPDDIDEVVALSLRAWAPNFASFENVLGQDIFLRLYPDWRVNQADAVIEALTSEKKEVWIGEEGDHIVGFVAIELDREHSAGEIHMLAVDPAHQNRGVGTALTTFALGQIKDSGMALAAVFTGGDPGHAAARRTYEKAEFTLLPLARYYKAL